MALERAIEGGAAEGKSARGARRSLQDEESSMSVGLLKDQRFQGIFASGGYGPQGGGYGAPPPGYGAPPPGYGAPPPGYGAPPPGYGAPPPGYGGPPPGYGYGEARPTSIAAVFSFVFAILGAVSCCIATPLTAPLGLLFGFVGLSATKVKSGRWMAVTGTLLNGLFVVAIAGVLALGGVGIYNQLQEAGQEAGVVLTQLQNGNVAQVYAEASEEYRARNSQAELQAIADKIKGLGTPTAEINVTGENWQTIDIKSETDISSQTESVRCPIKVKFAGGQEKFGVIALRRSGPSGNPGPWRLVDLSIQ